MTEINLLIVEDEILTAMALAQELAGEKIKVAELCTTVDQALTVCQGGKIDAALLDINLSGGRDGIHLAETLNQKYGIPVMFMTGYTASQVKDDLAGIDMIGICEKPVKPERISEDLLQYFSCDCVY